MDLMVIVTLVVLMGQWQWMLGSLLAGMLVVGAVSHLLQHANKSYRMYLLIAFTVSVTWVVFEFWNHCVEWANANGSSAMHIGMPPMLPFVLGALAFLIGVALVVAARNMRRPSAATNAG